MEILKPSETTDSWYMDNGNIAMCNHRLKKLSVNKMTEISPYQEFKWNSVAKIQAEPLAKLLKYLKQEKLNSVSLHYNPNRMTVDVKGEEQGYQINVGLSMTTEDNPVGTSTYRSRFALSYLLAFFEGYKATDLRQMTVLVYLDNDYPVMLQLSNGNKMIIAPRVDMNEVR